MCGICGFSFEDKQLVKSMLKLISHRGPDESANFTSKGISFGMRRLSIIDLKKGLYPVHNENDTLFLIFNGEIYNYKELRANLIKNGHEFYSDCDAEVIIHLYEDYGKECVKFLNGMFAIALWDTENKTLFLSRDRLGIKPLYYHYDGTYITFASEAKCILLFPKFRKELNVNALHEYLSFRCNSSSETMFKGIFKLEPGCSLIFNGKSIIKERYWDFKIKSKFSNQTGIEKELLKRLRKSIEMRLMSDVPLGAYISGGVDSGSMVAIMSQFMDEPVKTFSVLFAEESEKELANARFLAEHYETDHHEIIVDGGVTKILPQVVWHLDEPMCDPTCLPTYVLAKNSKKRVTVVLTGDGSDEQFAGYEQFKILQMHKKYARPFPTALRKLAPLAASIVPPQLLDKVFKYASSLGEKGLERFSEFISTNDRTKMYLSLVSIFSEKEKKELYTQEISFKNNSEQYLSGFKRYFSCKTDYLSQYLRLDLDKMLAEGILMKTDKSTMAFSTEARVPFLDHNLWEFSMLINPNLKLKGSMDKYILRKALSRLVPTRVTKKKKDRFFVPIDSWLSGELGEITNQLLDKDELKKTGVFNHGYVERMQRNFKKSKLYYSRQLWSLLCFQLWHKIYFQRDFKKKSAQRF